MKENLNWLISCINSCANKEQLSVCQVMMDLFRNRMVADSTTESEIREAEQKMWEAYVSKEAMLNI